MANLSDLIGGGAVQLGGSYATGTASATIVSAAANTNGVIISTACINHSGYGGSSSLLAGSAVLLALRDYSGGSAQRQSAVSISGVKVPAGVAISFTTDATNDAYHITYEVL